MKKSDQSIAGKRAGKRMESNTNINCIFLWWLCIQNHIKVSITRSDKIRLRTWHNIPWDLNLQRTSLYLLKALNMSSATGWVALDLIKALAILSETNIKRSAGESYILETGKKYFIFWSGQSSYILITSFSKILLITKRILPGK